MKTTRLMTVALVVLAGCATPYSADSAAGEPAAKDPAPTGCDANGTYRFCDDFDHRAAVDDGRWQVSVGGAGALSIDEGESTSRGGAALSSAPTGKATAVACLVKELVLTGLKARTELDMRLDTEIASIRSGTVLLAVGLASGESAAILIGGGHLTLQIGKQDGTLRSVPLEPFPTGAWSHVVLEIAFDANDGRVFFSADDKVLVDERRLALLGPATQTTTFQVIAGVNGSAEVPVELRIYNVKVY